MSRRKNVAPVVTFVSLADIAREININPKRARATFRRLDAKNALAAFTRHPEHRHQFDATHRDEIVALLTPAS